MEKNLCIGFRVDASNIIGTGHLVETVTLINDMKRRMTFTPLVITYMNPFTEEKLKPLDGVLVRQIKQDLSEEDEIREVIRILNEEGCRHLVTNLLDRSGHFYGDLSEHLSTLCVILDNEIHAEISATIVVNFSVCQDLAFYRQCKKYKTKYLIGPKYYPMGEAIQNVNSPFISESVKNIFINQGGSDPFGLTIKIIRAMQQIPLYQNIHVVLGGGMLEHHVQEIDSGRFGLGKNYQFYYNIPQQQVYSLMSISDLALSAAGNVLYELAFLGVPTIIVSHHERHAKVAEHFVTSNAAIHAGIGRNVTETQLSEMINDIIDNTQRRLLLSREAKRLCDGKGTENIIKELIPYYEA